jgi:type III restriction enzyme
LSGLAVKETERVNVESLPNGAVSVTIHGEISDELEERLLATATTTEASEAIKSAVYRHRIQYRDKTSPVERGERFPMPRLFVNIQGKLELVEQEFILDLGGWTLNGYAPELTPEEFSIYDTTERWEIDVRSDKVVYSHLEQNVQLEIGILKMDWTDLELSRWLDHELHQRDITRPVLLEFCRKVVAYLMERRHIPLNDLLRFKYQLARAVKQKIADYRKAAYTTGYQTFLLSPDAHVETRFGDFSFENRGYPFASSYQGAYQFKKHFFGTVGDLSNSGEEFECAKIIDTLPQIKYWIRNLAKQEQTSFWLPTSTDRFYPDFVAQLHDGRVLVIEYKGAHLADTQDTKEKKNIGELWAAKSNGKAIFLMAEQRNIRGQGIKEQISALLGG